MDVVLCIMRIILKLLIRIFVDRDVKFIYNINSIIKNKRISILIMNILSIERNHIFRDFLNFFTQNEFASQEI